MLTHKDVPMHRLHELLIHRIPYAPYLSRC